MGVREGAGSEATDRRVGGGQRVQFEALVAVGETDGGGFEAESVDVSKDGMRLRTAFLPEVGDKLVCRFDSMGNELVVDGEVLWRNEAARGGDFGLRFFDLDNDTEKAVRAMCEALAAPDTEEASAEEPSVPRGSRVRLHIDGLGSPMKARVRESAAREVEVGSNLEFLKVGRALELEDVEAGKKREALVDSVKVDVDPATNVPQLVVTLRYDKTREASKRPEKARPSSPPPARRAAASVPPVAMTEDAEADVKAEASGAEAIAGDVEPSEPGAARRLGDRAVSAGRVMAGKIAPALSGMSTRARSAMAGVAALVARRRQERAEAKKAAAPRRTTAPPPGGALTAAGRRLVREDGASDSDNAAPPRINRRAAVVGGAMGLAAVLAIFGATRAISGHGQATVDARAAVSATALPADVPVASGTPLANVPLFGATPLSTTEPVPVDPAPSASAAAQAPPGDDDDSLGDNAGGPILKEWGKGEIGAHPVVLRIKMDGDIERITGAAGAQGFTISVPGHRSVSSVTNLARKDKRLASVNVVNTSRGAEVSVEFKDNVPSYLARVKNDRLEIAISKHKDGHSKVAKSKKAGKKKKKTH